MDTLDEAIKIRYVDNKMDDLSKAMAVFDITKVRRSISYSTQTSKESESSVEIYVINDDSDMSKKQSETDTSAEERMAHKRVKFANGGALRTESGLSRKDFDQNIHKITELVTQQSTLLGVITEEVKRSNVAVQHTVDTHARLASELLNIALSDRSEKFEAQVSAVVSNVSTSGSGSWSTSAGALMAALKVKHKEVEADNFKKLIQEVLESDIFRKQLTTAISDALKTVLEGPLSKVLHSSCAEDMVKWHRAMMGDVSIVLEEGFAKLDMIASAFARDSYKTSRWLRMTLERHVAAVSSATKSDCAQLQEAIRVGLEQELSHWRQQLASVLEAHASMQPCHTTHSPAQVAEHNGTLSEPTANNIQQCDQNMGVTKVAMPLKQSDINSSFEHALTSSDLAMVMDVCRAADLALVFGPPCLLEQNVLLSLIQQLATDMVHETQLKCRYLEEAIMHLDKTNQVTVAHISVVAEDVKAHLQSYLVRYPGHQLSRRLRMIIMAADSFLVNNQ